ncbi:MAG: chemotaxis-specific protein-glutamate methyltransferase CheB [Gemmatimonadaceae bacterium]
MTAPRQIRVLVVDDSATSRQLLCAILRGDPGIAVIGEASNGAEAVEKALKLGPDLITMDVQMPVMNGIEATKEIMIVAPTPIIIVSAAGNQAGLDHSFDAMQAGALMVLAKPAAPQAPQFAEQSVQLIDMVKAMAHLKVVRRWGPRGVSPSGAVRASTARPGVGPLVAIGTSTGGPAALRRILIALPSEFPAPVAIVQHIANGFVGGLASWLSGSCSLHVKVAEEGERVTPHNVYIGPDDRHFGFTPDGRVSLSDGPPIGGFRPSVSHLFDSAAQVYGGNLTAVVLTGMGSDGVSGLGAARRAGARVLAQDAATSVVFGMANEAVNAGVVHEVLPVDLIAPRLIELHS